MNSPANGDREAFEAYCQDGVERALALGNRGPMRFDDDGRLARDIVDAYNEHGFYVFTGVLSQSEINDLTREFDALLDNAPRSTEDELDSHGRPSRYGGYMTLSRRDAEGDLDAGDDAPMRVGLVSHPLMFMHSALCVYAHPDILRMVASIHGDDFVPFHESIFHKGAGEGPPTSWHQDGRTHWTEDGAVIEGRDGSGKKHGFNLSVSWSHCTPENGLWVVPGSQRQWRLAGGGSFPPISERIPEAVPMMLAPGDCGMVNRSSLHGSFPNRSPERRITMVMGYHSRESAIGTKTTNVHAFMRPIREGEPREYSEDYVLRRTRMIPLAIDARRQKYPDEEPYVYKGSFVGSAEWNDATRAEISREGDEYWRRDITL